MSFVSYAQNFEDVLLWRALGHVGAGFYIDVGAWSPLVDSVTAAFYERGWRGINIEPNPRFLEQLRSERPRDINLGVAVADADGTAAMHILDNPGLSTLLDEVADAHARQGVAGSRQVVEVMRLAEVWRREVPAGQPVHFLKVDVEGAEASVLRSNDWSRNRPWVLVVEATAPMSQQSHHGDWEPLLLAAAYRLAYNDGINRYYIAAEHGELLAAFDHPPNYFDGFVTYAEARATREAEDAMARAATEHRRAALADERAWQSEMRAARAEEAAWRAETRSARAERLAAAAEDRAAKADAWAAKAEARTEQAEARAAQADERAQNAEQREVGLQGRLQAISESWSWRITAPLRAALDLMLRLRAGPQRPAAPVSPPFRPAPQPASSLLANAAASPPPRLPVDDRPAPVRRLLADLKRLAVPPASTEDGALPRLAYVSPLPPECSGIADYSADLLPALCQHFRIDVVVEQARIDAEAITERCAVRDSAWLRAHAGDYDAVLYHFGNSHFHTWMADLLPAVPGIVVLHDFHLGGLAWSIADQPGRAAERYEQLQYSHGQVALAECLRNTVDPGEAFFRYPCNRPVLEQARGVVVHSEEAERLARRWFGPEAAADWIRIPLARTPAPAGGRQAARQRLGLPESVFIVCNFGLIGATKLNHRLLQAWLDSTLAQEADGLLIYVGDGSAGDYARALRSRIEASGLGARIRITGWADAATFRDYLAAADLAVQLRSHSRGETSATVLDCMNHGLATIVNAHGSMAELPADCVCRLPDAFAHGQLIDALETLRGDSMARQALGERARALIAREYLPAHCAQLYRQAIDRVRERDGERRAGLRAALGQRGPAGAGDEALLEVAERLAIGEGARYRLPQLLLDVTETARTDRRTGIERVARALAMALLEAPPEGWRVEPVVLSESGGRWHYRAANRFAAELLGVAPPLADRAIDITRGDRLLGLDYSGDSFIRASADGLYRELRAGGVDCRALVFDLLPLSHPECFPPQADLGFRAWLDCVAQLDGAACISKTVAGKLRTWMRDRHADRAEDFEVGSFPLGADVAAAAPSRGLPHDAEMLLARLAAEPTVLMVGTLEPRKRHLQALAAFSLLWHRGRQVNLVIVGRAGWQHLPAELQRDIPELLQALRGHPESGRRLFWLEGASDEYLERLYASARGLLAASVDEGFGLPLVEASVKGLPVLARDIPVFREVAGDGAQYFSGDSAGDLAQAIDGWIASGFGPKGGAAVPPVSWKQSADELLRVVLGPKRPTEADSALDNRTD